MPEKPEAVVSNHYVTTVLDQVLGDLLSRLERELGHPLRAHVALYSGGQLIQDYGERSSSPSPQQPIQCGEVRVRFRPTAIDQRFLFFLDAVFEHDVRRPAFSGFSVSGDVRPRNAELCAGFSTWVVKRNDWTWQKWL